MKKQSKCHIRELYRGRYEGVDVFVQMSPFGAELVCNIDARRLGVFWKREGLNCARLK